ncbi:MAG TPA: alpha/beta hydrolase, partial [Xanthomonadaceae bacterium]|nr:alpha/beta hydrolase [Xanthomonadaceae bacterium]
QERPRHAARGDLPPDAALALAQRLRKRLPVDYRELPGLSHGQTLGASIAPALRFATQPD